MAQLLKDEVRLAIINSSKKEFLKNGYENASMRNIAKGANMTVGNLYRYFKNKEEINITIVSDVLEKINNMVKNISNDSVDFKSKNFKFKFDEKTLLKMLDKLSDELVDIYQENKDGFNILMLHSELNKSISNWFKDLIKHFIDDNYKIPGFEKEKQLMAKAFSVSIFDGIKELFKDDSIKVSHLKMMVKTYLKAYVKMMDLDIRKIVGV